VSALLKKRHDVATQGSLLKMFLCGYLCLHGAI